MEEALLNAVLAHIHQMQLASPYYENVGGDTPRGDHTRVSILPTTPEKLRICGDTSKHTWIAQVSIYIREGKGVFPIARFIDELREKTPVGTRLSYGGYTFHTEDKAHAVDAVQSDDGWFFIPVQFRVHIFN